MIKKIYTINGFDCANCAMKTENHLNKNANIEYARIDFAANHLYITFKDKELSIDEIKKIIAEVESDSISLEEMDYSFKKIKMFDRSSWILLGRIIFSIVIILLCKLCFTGDTHYWLRFSLYLTGVVAVSYDVFYKVLYKIFHLQNPVDEFLLIMIASIGAFVLASLEQSDEHMEAILVVCLFQIGRVIESIATKKTKAAVMSAVNLRADYANLITNDEIQKVRPEQLKINDVVLINSGESIPVDGKVIEGEAYVDLSSLTGEYIPSLARVNDEVLSGCVIKSGSIKVSVNKEYSDSTVSKIMELISTSGERKTKTSKFITKFARWYTPIVVLVSSLIILILGLISKDWQSSTYQGLEVLVVACPCAIVISVPLAYFSAIGLASKKGIVVKGSDRFDDLVKMKLLVTDKTGTLTHGSFSIQTIVCENGVEEKELLNSLYIAECLSNHPIGKAICHGQKLHKIAAQQENYKEIPGFGTSTTYKKNNYLAGNKLFLKQEGIETPEVKENGTIVYVAKNSKLLGYVVLADEVKNDAQPMVNLLHHEGIKILLLTGDKEENARDICHKLGIDRYVSDLTPEKKTLVLEKEMENVHNVAFIGDGINDAPSIKRSDIGIAMGGIGSDAAVENADVVIMNDDPAKVYDAYKISKMGRNTAIFNIVVSLAIKISVMVLALVLPLWHVELPMWVAVLADTGLTVLMIINSLILLYRPVKRPITKK